MADHTRRHRPGGRSWLTCRLSTPYRTEAGWAGKRIALTEAGADAVIDTMADPDPDPASGLRGVRLVA